VSEGVIEHFAALKIGAELMDFVFACAQLGLDQVAAASAAGKGQGQTKTGRREKRPPK
jgi:hypothetical protein